MLALMGVLASTWVGYAQSQDEPARDDDPFVSRGWHLQLAAHGALEAWNYNIAREQLFGLAPGLTYGLREGLVFTASWPLYYVAQRGVDGWLFGATIGIRGRVYRRPRFSLFLELDAGASHADSYVPPRGTRFNYLALGGGGAAIRMRPGLHLLASMRWIHVSNNGLAGRDRNPDIEAVGPQLGLLIRF